MICANRYNSRTVDAGLVDIADSKKESAVLSVYIRPILTCDQTDIHHRRCRCPKWIQGLLDGKLVRVSAGTRSWEKAELKLREMELFIPPPDPASRCQHRKRLLNTLRLRFITARQENARRTAIAPSTGFRWRLLRHQVFQQPPAHPCTCQRDDGIAFRSLAWLAKCPKERLA